MTTVLGRHRTTDGAVTAPARTWVRWVPLLVYVAAVAVLLGPALVGARVVLPHDLLTERLPFSTAVDQQVVPLNLELRDVIDTYYPVQAELWGRIADGGDVAWIRDLSLGMPGVQFLGWGALSPFNWPALVLPFELVWSWAMALRLLVAMGGTHLLVRSFGVGRLGATVAGLAYGLSGYMVLWLGWPQSHVGAWIPVVCWAARRTAGRDAPWWGGPALAAATAALWLGGFPAVALYGLLAAGVVALHAAVQARADGRPPWRGLVAAAGAVVAGTGVVAFTLLPTLRFLDLLDLVERANHWQARIPPQGLLTFLVPEAFGSVSAPPRWLPIAHVESVGYVGVGTVVLGLWAWLAAPRRRGVWLWTGIAVVALLAAYGFPPVQWVIARTPMLSGNPPPRALSVAGLGLAVVGGLGADALQAWVGGRLRLRRRALLAAGGVATLALLVALLTDPVGQLRELAAERLGDPDLVAAASGHLLAGVRTAGALLLALVLVVAGGVAVHRRRPALAGGVVAAGLIGVVGLDLLLAASGWNIQTPRDELWPVVPTLERLAEVSTDHRVVASDHIMLPSTHLLYDIADLRAHTFLSPRQREVLRAAGARFASPTSWDLRAEHSDTWEPWLSAASVARALVPADVDGVPQPLPSPGDDHQPIGAFARSATRVAPVVAERAGTITGLAVRVGTFDRANDGTIEAVLFAGGDRLADGELPLAGLVDNGVAVIPLDPVEVEDDRTYRAYLKVTTPSFADQVALYGSGDRPDVALTYDDDEVWPTRDGELVDELVNLDALPRVHAATAAQVVPPGDGLEVVGSLGAAALAEVAVVDDVADLPVLPDGTGTATVESWEADGSRIRATVSSDAGAVLLATEAAFDGWRAEVDGAPTTALTVNHLFVGAAVPPGTHEVVLSYRMPGTTAGVALSVTAAAALAAASALAWRRRPQSSPDRR